MTYAFTFTLNDLFGMLFVLFLALADLSWMKSGVRCEAFQAFGHDMWYGVDVLYQCIMHAHVWKWKWQILHWFFALSCISLIESLNYMIHDVFEVEMIHLNLSIRISYTYTASLGSSHSVVPSTPVLVILFLCRFYIVPRARISESEEFVVCEGFLYRRRRTNNRLHSQ